MSTYGVRPATLDDLEALVHHRVAMFTDMGVVFDAPAPASHARGERGIGAPTGLAKPGGFR